MRRLRIKSTDCLSGAGTTPDNADDAICLAVYTDTLKCHLTDWCLVRNREKCRKSVEKRFDSSAEYTDDRLFDLPNLEARHQLVDTRFVRVIEQLDVANNSGSLTCRVAREPEDTALEHAPWIYPRPCYTGVGSSFNVGKTDR